MSFTSAIERFGIEARNYTEAMISVRGVSKRFGDRTVIDGIDLEVEKGTILAIMGSSGGGKTTLLRCIAGLIVPDKGSVEIDGINVHRDPEEARRRLGMVFQSSALFDYLSVRENVLFGIKRQRRNSKQELDELVDELLETVGLSDAADKLPGELSGGMKKRVGIARALAMRPNAMLYDEPITGLDPITAYTIDRLIFDVQNKYQVASIVVSHDISSVFRIADQVAFLHEGRTAFLGTVEEFETSEQPEIEDIVRKSETRSFLTETN